MAETEAPAHYGESQWAVETHGLTKRFGENIAVNDVELLVPRGCAFGYLGPERSRQDNADPGAARADPRRCRHDVPSRPRRPSAP